MTGKSSTSEELNALRLGYPSLSEVDTDQVLLVFWGTHGDRTAIHWRRFAVEDVPAVLRI
jgi:hypothetical protein